MILPDWETDFAAARDMKCSNSGIDNTLIIRGRIDSQGYSNWLCRGPEYKGHRLKIIIEGKEIKLDNFKHIFLATSKVQISLQYRYILGEKFFTDTIRDITNSHKFCICWRYRGFRKVVCNVQNLLRKNY